MTMNTDHYISSLEAERLAQTQNTYLHKLAKANKIRHEYRPENGKRRLYIDPTCPRFQQLVSKELAPGKKRVSAPKSSGQHPFDWSLWEDMCRAGEKSVVRKGCSEQTIINYRYWINRFFRSFNELSRENLRTFFKSFKSTATSDYGASKIYAFRALMTVAKYWRYKGFVSDDWVKELGHLKPDPSNNEPRRPFQSAKTVKSVVNILPTLTNELSPNQPTYTERDRLLITVLIILGFMHGLRCGEICSIRLDDLDWSTRRLSIRGKGGNGQVTRRFVISKQAVDAIRSYLAVRPESSSDLMLVGSNGNPLNRRSVASRYKRLSNRLKLDGFTSHSMRRGFARWSILDRKVDIFTTQDLLGHKTLKMTKIYSQRSQEDLDKVSGSAEL